MIPWFVTRVVAAIVRPFGYQLLVRATVGRRGADAVFLVREGQFSTALIGDLDALASAQADLITEHW